MTDEEFAQALAKIDAQDERIVAKLKRIDEALAKLREQR